MEHVNVLQGVLVHNQNVLIRASIQLGVMALNGLNNNVTKQVSNILNDAIEKADKVIVATNNSSEYKDLVGRTIVVEDGCVPEMRNVETDPLDLKNILKDFKHDFKDGASKNNGIMYPINIYFTVKEYQIVMTKEVANESK